MTNFLRGPRVYSSANSALRLFNQAEGFYKEIRIEVSGSAAESRNIKFLRDLRVYFSATSALRLFIKPKAFIKKYELKFPDLKQKVILIKISPRPPRVFLGDLRVTAVHQAEGLYKDSLNTILEIQIKNL